MIFTAQNTILARRTYELTEQGQATDRYIKAIEQLGSDKLDVRIGGIYALERVARDSARDHPTVMESFGRIHSFANTPVSNGRHPNANIMFLAAQCRSKQRVPTYRPPSRSSAAGNPATTARASASLARTHRRGPRRRDPHRRVPAHVAPAAAASLALISVMS